MFYRKDIDGETRVSVGIRILAEALSQAKPEAEFVEAYIGCHDGNLAVRVVLSEESQKLEKAGFRLVSEYV